MSATASSTPVHLETSINASAYLTRRSRLTEVRLAIEETESLLRTVLLVLARPPTIYSRCTLCFAICYGISTFGLRPLCVASIGNSVRLSLLHGGPSTYPDPHPPSSIHGVPELVEEARSDTSGVALVANSETPAADVASKAAGGVSPSPSATWIRARRDSA